MSAPAACHFCGGAVAPAEINRHHRRPRSEGGVRTVAAHARCHVAHHSERSDFRRWGRMGGLKTARLYPEVWRRNLRRAKANNIACANISEGV